jgi:hypothetical protein
MLARVAGPHLSLIRDAGGSGGHIENERQFTMFGKTLVGILVAALALGCVTTKTAGDGVPAHAERTVAPFREVETQGIDARIVVDPASPGDVIAVDGDSNLVSLVRTHVDDGRLIIELDDDDREVAPRVPLKVVVHTPRLTEVHAERGAHVDITLNTKAPLLIGAGSNAGIVARGEVSKLDIELEGSSDIQARGLLAHDVHLEANGSSRADVCATWRLDATASGGSSVNYYCRPTDVDDDASGSAHIHRAE